MKRVNFPIYDTESYLVTYTVDNEKFGIYVMAVNQNDAVAQVLELVPSATDFYVTKGKPSYLLD